MAQNTPKDKSHIPAGSFFYNKVVPVLLIGMAVLTVAFIVVALGILLGFVPFR
jgi:hypothetical protein